MLLNLGPDKPLLRNLGQKRAGHAMRPPHTWPRHPEHWSWAPSQGLHGADTVISLLELLSAGPSPLPPWASSVWGPVM